MSPRYNVYRGTELVETIDTDLERLLNPPERWSTIVEFASGTPADTLQAVLDDIGAAVERAIADTPARIISIYEEDYT